jgi:predicted regulator of Ras-like GTPase activity (Roadblock/LC7/MglB family)
VEGGIALATRVIDEYKLGRLKSLLQNLPQLGISFYMVGTKEGLSVVSDATVDMPDPDLLSAATATMLSTGDFLSDKYKEGVTREIMVHVERGYILVFRAGVNHNLAAVVGNVTNLDYYLDILRKYAKAVEEIVIPGEQVEEAEEMLKRELDLIGVQAVGSEGKLADAASAGGVKPPGPDAQKSKRSAPKPGKVRRQ